MDASTAGWRQLQEPSSASDPKSFFAGIAEAIRNGSLTIPLTVASCLLVLQIIQIAFRATIRDCRNKPARGPISLQVTDTDTEYLDGIALQLNPSRIDQFQQSSEAGQSGDPAINAYSIARLIGCLTLLILSTLSIFKICRNPRCMVESSEKYMILIYLYCTILATLSLKTWRFQMLATRHNIPILLTSFMLYTYRDIWPLATYTKSPMDQNDGRLLWVKISVLSFTAILLPLSTPCIHVSPKSEVPIDGSTSSHRQRISILAFMARQHLPSVAELDSPTNLPKTEQTNSLVERTIPHWQKEAKKKDGSLFDAMVALFWKEYVVMALAVVVQVLLGFVSPIGINRLLRYVETEGADASIRPWVWIICISVGPLLQGLCGQFYHTLSTYVDTFFKAITRQFVFARVLRIKHLAAQNYSSNDVNSQRPANQSITTDAPTKPASKVVYNTDTLKFLLEKDTKIPVEGSDLMSLFIKGPLQYLLCLCFLYSLLGLQITVSVGVLLVNGAGLVVPLHKQINAAALAHHKETKLRVQEVTETFNILRGVKLFGWEYGMESKIRATRNKELTIQRKIKLLTQAREVWMSVFPTLVMVLSFGRYLEANNGKGIPPSVLFTSIVIFGQLSVAVKDTVMFAIKFGMGAVAWIRVDTFLRETETLDIPRSGTDTTNNIVASSSDGSIGLGRVSFVYPTPINADIEPGISDLDQSSYSLVAQEDFLFKKDCVNVIVGPKKSGKTTLLLALLGELEPVQSNTQGWVNLPRGGGISYAAQNPLILNTTIRQNILLGTSYDEARYVEVLRQCALETFLKTLVDGDLTETGKVEIHFSEQQKAQIGLARAIYSRAKIILLDDILASLDTGTATWIVNECLQGRLIEGRTVLITTGRLDFIFPIAKPVVSISRNGLLRSMSEMDIEAYLANEVPTSDARMSSETEEVHSQEPEQNNDNSNALELSPSGVAGKVISSKLVMLLWVFVGLLTIGVDLGLKWYLGYWGAAEETKHFSASSRLSVILYLALLADVLLKVVASAFYVLMNIEGLKVMHAAIVASITGSTFQWMKHSPIHTILSTYAQDISTLDFQTSKDLHNLILGPMCVVAVLFVLASLVVSLVSALATLYLGLYLDKVNSKIAHRIEQRINRVHASVSTLNDTALSHATSIRAYGVESLLKSDSSHLMDHHTRLSGLKRDLKSWFQVRSIWISSLFIATIAAYVVYGCSMNAVNTGFLLLMAKNFFPLITRCSVWKLEFNKGARSLGHLYQYINVEQAPKPTNPTNSPPVWKSSGDIIVKNLSGRYSEIGPKVLSNISFHIKSGERITIVGKRGSGKTSLVLALLRCISTEGEVYLDGVLTKTLHFGVLRSRIAVIPEKPCKLMGTLRRNIDPFQQFDDAALNAALRTTGFVSLQQALGQDDISLDTDVNNPKIDITAGQWQLMVITRAIVHNCKIIIFEESDKAIQSDLKVHDTIQATLNTLGASGITVIIVAQSELPQLITDTDKIMVLDGGRMIEFDNARSLLANPNSAFSIINESRPEAMMAMYPLVE